VGNASDQFDNPTDEIEHYQKKHGAVYVGPKEGGKLGKFEIVEVDSKLKARKLEGESFSQQTFTGTLENSGLLGPPTRFPGSQKELKDEMTSSMRLAIANEAVVDVHTVNYDVYILESITSTRVVTFNINFQTGNSVKNSINVETSVIRREVHRYKQATSISTQFAISRARIPWSMERGNVQRIRDLKGTRSLQ